MRGIKSQRLLHESGNKDTKTPCLVQQENGRRSGAEYRLERCATRVHWPYDTRVPVARGSPGDQDLSGVWCATVAASASHARSLRKRLAVMPVRVLKKRAK